MLPAAAQRAIEALRKGIPPDGYVRHFTVGRQAEIDSLTQRLRDGETGALLLKANYGAGKTHLLRFIREIALDYDYAVSLIALDAKSAIRFNRMDQIFGATVRAVEVPRKEGKGPGVLFASLLDAMTSPCGDPQRERQLRELSSFGRWDYSKTLTSPALYVAVRAWLVGTLYGSQYPDIPLEVEAWMSEPWNYYTQTKWLYQRFVAGMRQHFRDPRVASQFYCRGVDTFVLRSSDHSQAWDALRDLNFIAHLSGYKGLVLLVDEFEDVIYNLRGGGVDCQMKAFWNLFRLFGGDYPGLSFYAVTPGFVHKCKELLKSKGYWDYDFSRFDALPTFEMSPLSEKELERLALRIVECHSQAYDWPAGNVLSSPDLRQLVKNCARQPIQDRTRKTITTLIKTLDDLLEGPE